LIRALRAARAISSGHRPPRQLAAAPARICRRRPRALDQGRACRTVLGAPRCHPRSRGAADFVEQFGTSAGFCRRARPRAAAQTYYGAMGSRRDINAVFQAAFTVSAPPGRNPAGAAPRSRALSSSDVEFTSGLSRLRATPKRQTNNTEGLCEFPKRRATSSTAFVASVVDEIGNPLPSAPQQ